MLLFAFIRSLRDADFPAFLNALRLITKWMLILNHVHYSRWLPVFIKDLEDLDPPTLEAFKKGYFTVKRSNRTFSNIGIDQAHEQNNKLVKIHGEAIGIFDNQNALLRWSVSTSIIAVMCNEDKEDNLTVKHHENNTSFENRYRKDVDALFKAINEMGNPFMEEEKNLVHLSSKVVLDAHVSKSVHSVTELGEDQFNKFFENRLQSEKESLYD